MESPSQIGRVHRYAIRTQPHVSYVIQHVLVDHVFSSQCFKCATLWEFNMNVISWILIIQLVEHADLTFHVIIFMKCISKGAARHHDSSTNIYVKFFILKHSTRHYDFSIHIYVTLWGNVFFMSFAVNVSSDKPSHLHKLTRSYIFCYDVARGLIKL